MVTKNQISIAKLKVITCAHSQLTSIGLANIDIECVGLIQ